MVELVVGDEAPYRVLARLGGENTITTGGQLPIVLKKELEARRQAARATASAAA